MKKLLKAILYKPYLLLLLYLLGHFYYFGTKHSGSETFNTISLFLLNFVIIFFVFNKLLKNSLLRLLNKAVFFRAVPDSVLTGYLFIFTLFSLIPAIILAIFAKLFIRANTTKSSYIDEYGNEVTQIKSFTPTVILSRKENGSDEEEHIVMTKLKKKPKKVTYE